MNDFENTEIENLKLLGEKKFKSGDFQESKNYLEKYIQNEGQCIDSFFYLGNIYHLEGQIGKAIKCLTKVLEFDPAHTDAILCLSVLYNDIGQYEKGKSLFDQANKQIKKDDRPLDDKVNVFLSTKHFELAELYFSYQKYEEAIVEYLKSIQLNPDALDYRIKLARVYAKKGLQEKAQEELNRLKNEYPKFADARIALGLLYFSMGKIIDAQSEWERGLVISPGDDRFKQYLQMSNNVSETRI